MCGAKDVSEPRGDERYCRDCWDKKIAVEDIVAREFTIKRYILANSAEKYLVFHATQKRPVAQIQVIDDGYVSVNGRVAKAAYKVRHDDQIRVVLPPPFHDLPTAEDIPLTVLYEDYYLALIDKPPNMVVHPAKGNWSGTLVNAILHHFDDLAGDGSSRGFGGHLRALGERRLTTGAVKLFGGGAVALLVASAASDERPARRWVTRARRRVRNPTPSWALAE